MHLTYLMHPVWQLIGIGIGIAAYVAGSKIKSLKNDERNNKIKTHLRFGVLTMVFLILGYG